MHPRRFGYFATLAGYTIYALDMDKISFCDRGACMTILKMKTISLLNSIDRIEKQFFFFFIIIDIMLILYIYYFSDHGKRILLKRTVFFLYFTRVFCKSIILDYRMISYVIIIKFGPNLVKVEVLPIQTLPNLIAQVEQNFVQV